MSIGKSSLARAAAAAGSRPTAENAPVLSGYQQVAVEAITAADGYKLTRRVSEELMASVMDNGILEPLTLAQTAPGVLALVAGNKRLAAAKKAKLATVPAVIVDMTAAQAAQARREVCRFATVTAQAVPEATVPEDTATRVGQSMPDWLL